MSSTAASNVLQLFSKTSAASSHSGHNAPVGRESEPSETEPAVDGDFNNPTAKVVIGSKRGMPAFSISWAAGFADGEGCICIVKQRYKDMKRKISYRLTFSVVQNNLQVLEHFQAGLGIHGVIYPVARLVGHNRQVYTLNYQGKAAFDLIAKLLPHLVRKSMEAQVAIEYWVNGLGGKRPGPGGWPPEVEVFREKYYRKLRALK